MNLADNISVFHSNYKFLWRIVLLCEKKIVRDRGRERCTEMVKVGMNADVHGHGHGHGHGVFILWTHPKGTWTTNPNPLALYEPFQAPTSLYDTENPWMVRNENVARMMSTSNNAKTCECMEHEIIKYAGSLSPSYSAKKFSSGHVHS